VAGYGGDGGLATAALLNSPWGVTVDASGDLFIADGKELSQNNVAKNWGFCILLL